MDVDGNEGARPPRLRPAMAPKGDVMINRYNQEAADIEAGNTPRAYNPVRPPAPFPCPTHACPEQRRVP